MPDPTTPPSVPSDPQATTGPTTLAAHAEPADTFDTSVIVPGYEILGEVGRGGMGVVYRAHDPAVNRHVAVKVLQQRYRKSPSATRRFVEEGQVTGQLQHPAIPAVHHIGTLPDGSPFLAMKLIKGDTLADRLAAPSPDRGGLVANFLQVAQAVAYAHSKGVIHRDLKPANVMVGQFGEVQVMDWGLAKVLAEAQPRPIPAQDTPPTEHSLVETGRSSDPGSYTQAGSVLGTPAYMSPEQAGGEIDKLDERADVFGLGAVLCEILTGKPPYRDATAAAIRLRAVRGELDDAFGRLDGCGADAELVSLCKRCLDRDRDARPRDAGAVAAAVSAHLAAVEGRLRQAERDRAAAEARAAEEANTRRVAEEKAAEQRKRRRSQRALTLCVGLLVLGAGGVAWWADRQAGQRRTDALRREIEDQKRAAEDARRAEAERERAARNAQAVEFALGQCEDALRSDDADRAAIPFELAGRRLTDGGADHLAGRHNRCRAELAMLRELNRIDEGRWTVTDRRLPNTAELDAAWSGAFRQFGVIPGETPADAAGRRIRESPIRDRLLTALDLWLVEAMSGELVAILRAADPDPFRDAVRDAMRVNDLTRLKNLLDRPEALEQPPWFAAVLGQRWTLPAARREQVLRAAHLRRPGELTVLMALGHLYAINTKDSAADRVRWFQAAVAVRPENSVAWNSLGLALYDKGDASSASAAYREAIRLDTKNVLAHNNLGAALRAGGDLAGAAAAIRAALRLDPGRAVFHFNLGITLGQMGDPNGAAAALREMIRLDPKSAPGHGYLGFALSELGDFDGAEAAFREALRLDPKLTLAQQGLASVLKLKASRGLPVAPPPRPADR
jgi:tetratricopeptide (TPR) repeat protein